MRKRIAFFLMIMFMVLTLASGASGFHNNANIDKSTNKQRDYDPAQAKLPVDPKNPNAGGYNGGHDTLTAEGMELKKKVHEGDEKFKQWANEEALPPMRQGAHDEDTAKLRLNSEVS